MSNNLETIIIFGGTSDIAQRCTNNWLIKKDYRFLLVGRNIANLERVANDLKIRFPNSIFKTLTLDFCDPVSISNLIRDVFLKYKIKISLIAYGSLSDQELTQHDLAYCKDELEQNGLSVCLVCESLSKAYEKQGSGTLAVIGSVAGDRARKSNYNYGSAKSLIESYVFGLYHRFYNSGINISLIKPGPTLSSMTKNIKGSANFADIEKVAGTIVKGIESKKKIIYAPKRWAYIMLIIKLLPNFIFNRLDI